MKKVLFLFVCMLNSLWASAQFSGSGSGTASDPYLIFNPTQLAQMANFLNNSDVVFELKNDIDLTEFINDNYPTEGWAPIGVNTTPFKGTLKGNNRTIRGLSINRPNTQYVGLFGYLNGATITDLSVVASTVKGASDTGTLVGYAEGSTIKNVNLTVQKVTGAGFTGGFAGRFFGTCQNITVSAVVSGTANVGGMVGSTGADIANCSVQGNVTSTSYYVGGFAGNTSNSTFTNCSQVGDVKGAGRVGGFCGNSQGTPTFTSCKSKGAIISTADYAGGILGYGDFVSMTNCSHFGDIQGTNYVGGVYGGNMPQSKNEEPVYYLSTSNTTNTKYATFTATYEKGETNIRTINKCTAIGNVSGENKVGGLIGSHEVARTFRYKSAKGSNPEYYQSVKLYLWRNDTYKASTSAGSGFYYTTYSPIDYVDYTMINVDNSYYSGNVSGKENVGGLMGKKVCGDLVHSYANANVDGATNVGGLIGNASGMVATDVTSNLAIKSCVAVNSRINATTESVGRIYGNKADDYVTIGALGTADGNLSLNKTSVVKSGVVQTITDDLQNGTSIGQSMLKLKATYVAKGWNFDNDWTIQETESYPYMRYQAAPPVFSSVPQSGDTQISGKSVSGGKVYIYIKDKLAGSASCNASNNWTFKTSALESGAEVKAYAFKDGLSPSYFTTTRVNFPGEGTEASPYLIYSAADLQGMTKGGYYKLMNDIDLTQWIRENSPTKGWVSVGFESSDAIYFNGDGHKITGLWCNTTDDYNGLFSNIPEGTITNLTVEVAKGKQVQGGDYTAVLAGRATSTSISNVTITGDVAGTVSVGGMVGYGLALSVTQSSFEGSVTATGDNAFVGGIAGYAHQVEKETKVESYVSDVRVNVKINATGTPSWVGGIFGRANGTIERVVALVDIETTGEASEKDGGILGYGWCNIHSCYTSGQMKATGSSAYVGGIAGQSERTVSDSYSDVKIFGTNLIGGISGQAKTPVRNCYSSGSIDGVKKAGGIVGQLYGANAKVQNCVALNPTITLTDESSWASRVIGGYSNGAADPDNSNYALKTMQVTLNGVPTKKYDDLVEGIGKEESILLTEAFYQSLGWNMTDTWGIDEGTGYPYLRWMRETEEPLYVTGDANGDNKVTVLDYLGIAKYILQGAFDGFNAQAADVNEDGKITVLDYLGVAKIILNGSLNSNHRVNAAALDLSSDCLTADAADGVLAIGLNNAGDYSMFQLDVTLPSGAKLVEVEGTERMSGNHTIDFAHQQGTTWRVLVGSRSLATIKGFEGDILHLNISGLTGGEVIIDNAEFVTPASVSTVMRPFSVSVGQPTGISNLLSTPQSKIYNLQGMRVNASQLTPDVYMVNGKKYIVK